MIFVPAQRRLLGPVMALLLAGLALVPASASGADPETPDAWAVDPVTAAPAPAEPLLDGPRRGLPALRQLGDQLATAAARNGLRPAELRTLLRTDETAWVDPGGRVLYVEPMPDEALAAGEGATGGEAPPVPPAPAPLADTFALHSNPGASRTIVLDFDGAVVSGTVWNRYYGLSATPQPAWDPGKNGAGFDDAERLQVQQVWALVAEDFAPFDVDVTTQDPGDAALVRSSETDPTYGTRVLITPSDDAMTRFCGYDGCGGVAYVDVFDWVGSFYQPAWVFAQVLGDAKNVAEAASHEAGHNLGLDHDGTQTQGYFAGHGAWAPIMGVGYYRPLAQWSRGAYPGANNTEDDVQILTGHLGVRPDEATGDPATPSLLPVGGAIISTADDVDAFLLDTCAAGSAVRVLPAAVAPNLDVRAVLYDSSGSPRAVTAPTSAYGGRSTATGLDGALTIPSDGGGWVLTVEGVGEGAWASSGYDDYGSLGPYTVSAPGCDAEPSTAVPGLPRDVVTSLVQQDSLDLSWSAPVPQGDGPVAAYVVSRSGSTDSWRLAADARSHTFTGLAAGTSYELSVRAVNARGLGRSVTVAAMTTAPPEPTSEPGPAPEPPTATPSGAAPSRMKAPKAAVRGSKVVLRWSPASANGSEVLSYVVDLRKGKDSRVSGSARTTVLKGLRPGRHKVRIRAVNALGTSPYTAWVKVRVR